MFPSLAIVFLFLKNVSASGKCASVSGESVSVSAKVFLYLENVFCVVSCSFTENN